MHISRKEGDCDMKRHLKKKKKKKKGLENHRKKMNRLQLYQLFQ